jgi:hypothetical protein
MCASLSVVEVRGFRKARFYLRIVLPLRLDPALLHGDEPRRQCRGLLYSARLGPPTARADPFIAAERRLRSASAKLQRTRKGPVSSTAAQPDLTVKPNAE